MNPDILQVTEFINKYTNLFYVCFMCPRILKKKHENDEERIENIKIPNWNCLK